MTRSRRTLILAVAGFVISCGLACAQAPASRPDSSQESRQAAKVLEQLQKDVEDPAKLDAVRVLLDDAMKKYASQGKDYVGALVEVETTLTINTLKRAVAAARAKDAQGQLADALATYDDSIAGFFKTIGPRYDKRLIVLYKEVIIEIDKLAQRVETAEFELQQPERDMLSAQERALWGASADAINYAFATTGELKIEGTKERVTGICSLMAPKGTEWHDLVIDLEFTILANGFQLFLRFEQGQKGYMIQFKPSEGYELNKLYRMTIRIKGSTITLKAPDQPENRGIADATTSRSGGLAFGLNKGASVVVSRCSIKFLR